VGSSSGVIGKWGERVARNALVERGIFTVRHVRLTYSNSTIVCDLFHPSSATAYEVKTKTGSDRPNFKPRFWVYRKLLDEDVVRHVVFVLVSYGGKSHFSLEQWHMIRKAGFESFTIGG
jgi:hypothetical protein